MAMTVAEFFACADALPFADVPTLVGAGGLLVVAPHPDDESLGCGGLLALCQHAGRATHVAVVSDGTGSHPTSQKYPADALRALRESEAVTAIASLGLRENALTFLRLRDRHVPATGPDADAAVDQLISLGRTVRASAVAVTWRGDPHCDHQASFTLAQRAAQALGARLLEYPVWGHTRAPEEVVDVRLAGDRLDITSVLARKKAAIAAHRSQMTGLIDDDPYGFALPPAMIARFERPFEVYLRTA